MSHIGSRIQKIRNARQQSLLQEASMALQEILTQIAPRVARWQFLEELGVLLALAVVAC